MSFFHISQEASQGRTSEKMNFHIYDKEKCWGLELIIFSNYHISIDTGIKVANNGGEECVMKIWGAGNGFTGWTHMMNHHLNTRRLLAGTFA